MSPEPSSEIPIKPLARILVVDDEPAMRSTLSATLQHAGYEVRVAGNGAEAIELSQAGALDLMITDIHMPERDGLSTIRELRRAHPQLKIIAMTGSSLEEYLRWASKLGADVVLAKPFSRQTILEAVMRLFSQTNTLPPRCSS